MGWPALVFRSVPFDPAAVQFGTQKPLHKGHPLRLPRVPFAIFRYGVHFGSWHDVAETSGSVLDGSPTLVVGRMTRCVPDLTTLARRSTAAHGKRHLSRAPGVAAKARLRTVVSDNRSVRFRYPTHRDPGRSVPLNRYLASRPIPVVSLDRTPISVADQAAFEIHLLPSELFSI